MCLNMGLLHVPAPISELELRLPVYPLAFQIVLCIFVAESCRCFDIISRLPPVAKFVIGDTTVFISISVFWIDLDGLVKVLHRLTKVAEPAVGDTPVIIGLGIF